MAIKSFSKLIGIDLSENVSKKPVFKKNKQGGYDKVGELDYLNWADCLSLLYQNGAEKVLFGNVRSGADHPLFLINGTAPFVRVYVEVDGDRRELDFPVIDGSNDISVEKLKQSDIHNATQRGFVKCVAINWGLGLSLWQREDKEAEKRRKPSDDLEFHNIMAIKARVDRFITGKLQGGMSMDDILSCMNLSERDFKTYIGFFDRIAQFEARLAKVK